MISLILNIAGFNIKINFFKTELKLLQRDFYKQICKFHQGFITTSKTSRVDYTIDVVERRELEVLIRKKDKKTLIEFYDFSKRKKIITYYQISLIHFQFILRNILLELLAISQGFLLHASAVSIHHKAYVFLGQSGAGKSTTMRLLNRIGAVPLADDTVIIKKSITHWQLYQTPFIEKASWLKKNRLSYSIQGFYFIKKAVQCKKIFIHNKEKIVDLLTQQLCSEKELFPEQIKCLFQLVKQSDNFFYLECRKESKQLFTTLIL